MRSIDDGYAVRMALTPPSRCHQWRGCMMASAQMLATAVKDGIASSAAMLRWVMSRAGLREERSRHLQTRAGSFLVKLKSLHFCNFSKVKKWHQFFHLDIFGNYLILTLGINLAMCMGIITHLTYIGLRMTISAPPQAQWLQCLLLYAGRQLCTYCTSPSPTVQYLTTMHQLQCMDTFRWPTIPHHAPIHMDYSVCWLTTRWYRRSFMITHHLVALLSSLRNIFFEVSPETTQYEIGIMQCDGQYPARQIFSPLCSYPWNLCWMTPLQDSGGARWFLDFLSILGSLSYSGSIPKAYFSVQVSYVCSGYEFFSFALCIVRATGHYVLSTVCIDLQSRQVATVLTLCKCLLIIVLWWCLFLV